MLDADALLRIFSDPALNIDGMGTAATARFDVAMRSWWSQMNRAGAP